MKLLTIGCLLCSVLLAASIADARTWLVKQDGSWDCTTIQACIDSASSGDTVLVGPGIYHERILITSRASGVRIKSETGPHETIIDGATYRGSVVMIDSAGPGSSLQGFTIRNGEQLRLSGGWGGGIGCYDSYILVEGNTIIHNSCEPLQLQQVCALGICCVRGAPVIRRNLVVHNSGEAMPIKPTAAVLLSNDASTVQENTIAYSYGERVEGILVMGSGASITGNIIAYNGGYGIRCLSGPPYPIPGCNDLWANASGNYYGCDPGNGDISQDPEFCNPEHDNFFLCESSPCVDVIGCGQIGAFGVGCGPTTVKGTTWGRIKATFR